MRVSGEPDRQGLQHRTKRFKLGLRLAQRSVEGGLVGLVEGPKIDLRNCLVQLAFVRRRVHSNRGQQDRRRFDLVDQIGRVRPGRYEIDPGAGVGEGLHIHGVKQFHRNHRLFARRGAVEEHDRFEVLAHGDPAAVEIDDLGHRPVRAGIELEPDAGTGQIVAAERLWDLNGATKPDGVVADFRSGRSRLPLAVVEGRRLAVRNVSLVVAPSSQR